MRKRFIVPLCGFALWLSGCAQITAAVDDKAFRDDGASAVFRSGYTLIQDRYIDPVSASDVAIAGLESLNKLDEAVVVAPRGEALHVELPRGVALDLPMPRPDDVSGWSELTVQVISAARADSAALAGAAREEIYQTVFKGALGKLDRYSRYSPAVAAQNARASRDGYGGIGIRLKQDTPGQARIEAVMPDTPAARAGIRPGDRIVKIGDTDVSTLDESEVVNRLRGPVSSSVKLTLARGEQPEPLVLSVSRALIFNPTVQYEPRGNAAVIKLSAFNQSTSRNLSRAIERARREIGDDLKGIVLDMRDNPGGLLDQAVAVSDIFLSSGRIVSTRGRHPDSQQSYDATGRDMTNNLPLVVLVNGQSASAAEIVAAALQDRGRAVVVGSNTFGKGTVQNITRLPNDGELVLTWSRFHAPSGYAIANLGVLPNVCTSVPDANVDAMLDQINPLWMKQPILFSAWRLASVRDVRQLDSLRENCPRSKEAADTDLAVATRLIGDSTLYGRALQQANTMIAAPQSLEPPSGTASQALPAAAQPKS